MPLEPRFILGAPLTLASEGLVLSSPTSPAELIGVQAQPAPAPAPAPASGPAPLPPAADPLSPVGDPVGRKLPAGDAALANCASSSSTYSVNVWMAPITGDVTDVLEFGATSGRFRFHATACGASGLPTSVTVNYSKTGIAVSGTDYTGPLASNTNVTIPLVGSDTNKSGMAIREFTAVDDFTEEPDTPESVIVTITSATDNNGNGANLVAPSSGRGTVASNDYMSSTKSSLVIVPIGGSGHGYARIQKDGLRINGVRCVVVSIKDANGQPSTAFTVTPAVGEAIDSARVDVGESMYEDGIADITVSTGANTPSGTSAVVKVRFEPTDSSQNPSTLTHEFTVAAQPPKNP